MLSNAKKSSKCKQPSVKSTSIKGLSKDTLKQVSDLAFYVRYQKTKLQALKQKSEIHSGISEQNTLMRRMTSNASVNSMDAFLAEADLNEMANFLTFCGNVATDKLELVRQSQSYDKRQSKTSLKCESKNNKQEIRKCFNSTKLRFKQKFSSKITVETSISTGTISSTDTGYHSVDSDIESLSKTSATSIRKLNRLAAIHTNLTDLPLHSTPVTAVRTKKHTADDTETTFNADQTLQSENLEHMNEVQGKSVILQRFMADQTISVSTEFSGNDDCESPYVKRRRIGRYSMDEFDSDPDFLSDISEPCGTLDMAFNNDESECNITLNLQSRTLRRETAISNLNRISFVARNVGVDDKETLESQRMTLRRDSAISNLNRFSLLSSDTGMDTPDCSFPRMDETKSEDFSMDFTCDYDESDSENESMCNEDDCMDSFMKTRSFIDLPGDVTLSEQLNTS